MRRWKKALLVLAALLLLVIVFRGPLFRSLITYDPLSERKSIQLSNPLLLGTLNAELQHRRPGELKDMVDVALGITNHRLHFVAHHAPSDPNEFSAPECGANCVGYAALFTSLMNEMFRSEGLERRYVARHWVGRMHLLGFDLHSLSSSPFYADHDYVSVTDRTTGEVVHVDPTISDYLRIRYVTSN